MSVFKKSGRCLDNLGQILVQDGHWVINLMVSRACGFKASPSNHLSTAMNDNFNETFVADMQYLGFLNIMLYIMVREQDFTRTCSTFL